MMNDYRLILILVSIFLMPGAQAQTSESKNKFGVAVGYNHGLYKNLTLSPVVLYEYNSPFFEIGFGRKTKKDRLFDARLKYWNSTLKTDKAPKLNLGYENISLSFNYLYPITENEKLSVHTGIFSRTTAVSFEMFAGEFQQKLALAGRFKYQLNHKHAISAQLSVPFLFAVYGNLDFDFYSFRRYLGYNYGLTYEYQLSNKFDLTLTYFSSYDRVESNTVFRELQNQFKAGINYNF